MDKVEKYIDFIVEDLISKTEIDYQEYVIFFPFISYALGFVELGYIPYSHHSFPYKLMEYIKSTYGAREDELMWIQKLYRSKLKSIING